MSAILLSSIAVATAVAVASPTVPTPKNDILANFYGNTLITVDNGIKTYFYYNADHTFTGKVPQFYFVLKGTWSVNDKGEVCRIFDPLPPMLTNPDCGPMLVSKVGEVGRDGTGHAEKLVAGISP
jgi:hypothetical protein